MLESRGSLRAIVLGMIALCLLASVMGASARQEKNNGAGLKVAIFDPQRLRTESKFANETEKVLQQKKQQTFLRLTTWKNNSLLALTDQHRLGDLTVEASTAGANFPADKVAEKKKLEEQSKTLIDEFNRLQGNQAPSDVERNRITVLVRANSDTESRITAEDQKSQADLQQQFADASNKLVKDMRDSVSKIAKEKGYALVLSNDVAWYADADLTDQILTAMNKK